MIYQGIVLPIYERIILTVIFIAPIGFLMGFQFPSIIRLATGHNRKYADMIQSQIGSNKKFADSNNVSLEEINETDDHNVTLIWGVNIIASVIGSYPCSHFVNGGGAKQYTVGGSGILHWRIWHNVGKFTCTP